MRLLPVPWAAALRPQRPYDFRQVFQRIFFFHAMASFYADVKRPNYIRDKKRPVSCLISINILEYAAGKTAFFTLFPVTLLCYDGTQQGKE